MEHIEPREICDLHLTYLLLAQRMLKTDRAQALLQLGIPTKVADLLASLSLPQMLELSASDLILCSFRVADLPVTKTIAAEESRPASALQQAHLSIVLATTMAQRAAHIAP